MHFLVFHRSLWCSYVFWSMGASGLCLSCFSFLGNKFFYSVFDRFFLIDWMRFCTFRSGLCLSGRFCVLLLRLSHIGFLFIFNFLLSLCLLKFGLVFSGDSETLANHLVPTGSFSPQEFCIHFLG